MSFFSHSLFLLTCFLGELLYSRHTAPSCSQSRHYQAPINEKETTGNGGGAQDARGKFFFYFTLTKCLFITSYV